MLDMPLVAPPGTTRVHGSNLGGVLVAATHARPHPVGAASAGAHEFVIDVPDATFFEMQGNFPFALYLQAQ